MNNKFIYLIILNFFCLYTLNAQDLRDLANKHIGTQIKEWSLKDLGGNIHNSNDLKGNIILINFWAAGCGACVMIDKDLKELQLSLDSIGLRVVEIECDSRSNSTTIQSFIDKYHICESTLIGGYETSLKYSVKGFPTLFLIDKNGKIVYSHIGYFYDDTKTKMINQIKAIK